MKFPKEIKLGCFTIKLKILDNTIAYAVAEQQGSYLEKTNTIYLSEDIFDCFLKIVIKPFKDLALALI